MYKKNPLVMLSVITLIGCGSDSTTNAVKGLPAGQDVPNVNQGVPTFNDMAMSLKPLKSVNESSFETHYKNGLYLATMQTGVMQYMTATVNTSADSSASASANGAESASGGSVSTEDGFSSTITQEQGVDEADRVKYNGEHLFIANHGGYVYAYDEATGVSTNTPNVANVRVLKKQEDNSLATINTLNIGDEKNPSSIDGLYLSDNKLSVLSSHYSYGAMAGDVQFSIWNPGPQSFNVSLFDTTTPVAASEIADFSVDGYVISSRRVADNLIIVSSYSTVIEGLIYFPQSDEDKQKNYDLIQATDINNLLPQYTDASGVTKNLVSADNCYIPEDATIADGYNGIVTITTINIEDPTKVSSVCINSSMQGIYATPNSVYAYGSVDQKNSVIHKFSLDGESIEYKASGSFEGHMFGGGQSSLRFSEQGEYLRVVVTKNTGDSNDRFEHQLKVFTENSTTNELDLVAELPNDAHPEKLGKDNEDIYAVRYFGSKAYIVTFERIDPLYVLNLADNTQPFVESSLEIVGYSSYLHPISENLILGVGQNVDPNRFIGAGGVMPEGGSTPVSDEPTITEENDTDSSVTSSTTNSTVTTTDVKEDEIVEGAKIALFDVSGEPRLIKEFVFEGYTPAEYNYHALTYLKKSDDKHLFAMPVETWGSIVNAETGDAVWSSKSALQLFEVNISGADVEFNNTGSVEPEFESKNHYGSWDDRSVIDGDVIYYVHGPDVYKSLWDVPNAIVGPF